VAKLPKLDIGIEPKAASKIAVAIGGILSDTYVLIVKSHVYHWNVEGPLFLDLHELTEEHYKEMFAASDELAERIRQLGHKAPLSFRAMLPKSEVEEETSNKSAEAMISQLMTDHEALAKRIRTVASDASDSDDHVTTDLMTRRLAFHEKAAWMLRSLIG
jgi:starvation-inducible DNA-binding protein